MKKKLLYGFVILILAVIAFLIYFKLTVTINPPVPDDLSPLNLKRVKVDNDFYTCGNSWFKKCHVKSSDSIDRGTGLWELYVEGNAFERGVITGKLTKELIAKHENDFIEQINKIIPSKNYLHFLKYFVAWFCKNLDLYIPTEYQLEIYGISFSASDKYSYVGPKYQRILCYHAAHDIGHTLQNMNLVGCTSFSAWNKKTSDSSLIVGRNFDFYLGNEFAKDKIVCFVNPDKGYKFMFITWGGMLGAVSGMNEKGLTVTINAGKSNKPIQAKTPVSIVAREILQYAENINQAFYIADKRKIFVSQSFMIGSHQDNKTVIIEKSPDKTQLFSTNNDFIICTNHFQAQCKPGNISSQINQSPSYYRYKRVLELINKYPEINPVIAAKILRDKKGLNDVNIELGNEKAINQLIAHHSIIFKPSKLQVWVSTYPFQLGQYVAYDLNKIFNVSNIARQKQEIFEKALVIPPDSFLFSNDFKKYFNNFAK